MTRDEAITIIKSEMRIDDTKWASEWTNCFVGLGMLKLDDVKSPEEELRQAVDDANCGCVMSDELMGILRTRDLKVVRA